MNRKIKYVCECSGFPRISFEHDIDCPIRVGFFGAPIEWGVGEYGEIRINGDQIFIYSGPTWSRVFDKTAAEVIRDSRKKKMNKIIINEY